MRGVIPLDGFRISSRLARTVRSDAFTVTVDTAFKAVIAGCAAPQPGRDDTWINKRIRDLYVGLHELGHAHSVEVWQNDELVGGLYGVSLGRAFFGESMFHRSPRRLQGGAGASGGAADRGRLCLARHPICDRASAQLRRGRDPAAALPRAARPGDRGRRRISASCRSIIPSAAPRRCRSSRSARVRASARALRTAVIARSASDEQRQRWIARAAMRLRRRPCAVSNHEAALLPENPEQAARLLRRRWRRRRLRLNLRRRPRSRRPLRTLLGRRRRRRGGFGASGCAVTTVVSGPLQSVSQIS